MFVVCLLITYTLSPSPHSRNHPAVVGRDAIGVVFNVVAVMKIGHDSKVGCDPYREKHGGQAVVTENGKADIDKNFCCVVGTRDILE